MRLSFCFAAIIVAPYAATAQAQAASVDTSVGATIGHRAPPPEQAGQAAPIDAARLVKRSVRVGNRTIMVDQFVGDWTAVLVGRAS